MLRARPQTKNDSLNLYELFNFAGYTHVYLLNNFTWMRGDPNRLSKNNSWKWREPVLGD